MFITSAKLSLHFPARPSVCPLYHLTQVRKWDFISVVRNVTLVEENQHHESLYLTIMLQGLGAGDGPLQAGVRGELLALGLARLQEQGGRDRDQGQRGFQPGEGRS